MQSILNIEEIKRDDEQDEQTKFKIIDAHHQISCSFKRMKLHLLENKFAGYQLINFNISI